MTLIQCDFDGTVTEEDASFQILDNFTDGDWRQWLVKYRDGNITVGDFNARAFSMVRADEPTLVRFLRDAVKVRSGFRNLVAYCQQQQFRLVVVSNGLDFYIKAILEGIGVQGLEIRAARTLFKDGGIEVGYFGPDGKLLEDAFKETHSRQFRQEGYRIIYIGNGFSDARPARLADWVFARGELRDYCQKNGLPHTPFTDFGDVVRGLQSLG